MSHQVVPSMSLRSSEKRRRESTYPRAIADRIQLAQGNHLDLTTRAPQPDAAWEASGGRLSFACCRSSISVVSWS